jgi:hypothetical protein
VLALACGGSDALSGVTANPVIGVAADWLVEHGGTALLSETTEMIGTEKILARRAADPITAEQIVRLIQRQEKLTKKLLGPLAGRAITEREFNADFLLTYLVHPGTAIYVGYNSDLQNLDHGLLPDPAGLAGSVVGFYPISEIRRIAYRA